MKKKSPILIALAAFCLAAPGALQAQITDLTTFNGSNGAQPFAGLVLSGSTLYGTTESGGANGTGEVFSLPVGGGTPTVLATFLSDGTTGMYPFGSLLLSGGTLYGTTESGGPAGHGEIFSLPIGGGTPTVLASLTSTTGDYPMGGLVLSGSTLYGTASSGGSGQYGTVFSVPIGGGTTTVLASFNNTNGGTPEGSLLLSGSTLYGTTTSGGASGFGAVFSVPVTGGGATVLASLNNFNGSTPKGGLVLSGSTLYGTAEYGGSNNDGTIFTVPASGGPVTVLTNFTGANGQNPVAGLTLNNGILYGDTIYGGTASGYGVIFSIYATGGPLTTQASFSVSNGGNPEGDLVLDGTGSTFYGTTATSTNNDGVVFSAPVHPTASAPEPGSAGLLMAGLAVAATRRRRRR